MAEKKEPLSKEYPKSLYAGGERTAAHKIVADSDAERAARAEGFKMIDPEAEAKAAAAFAPEEAPKAPAKKAK